ncbi:Dyp-type peroxidase [Gordonia soli]|uniref:Putative peroxidase n=1 Tax=Gordonia soli NBRC 108243 TaxID=1223545 RepID=M0QFK2_9ACTN|nr:Dyp-type peroxidase [Gordonia soli]GAC67365.1 putative peroxidase [Gordonia soli NBRC 108243]
MPDARTPDRRGLSRRRLLTGGAAALGAAGVGAVATSASRSDAASIGGFGSETIPFRGAHQAGITTVPPAHVVFVAVDLAPSATVGDLRSILRLWTTDAERLTSGRPALADTEPELATAPARLTVTVGLGPEVFDRVGLGDRRPASVRQLPPFAVDRLESSWNGGDLLLQIGGDDPSAAAHATRVLLKNVRSMTSVRWQQRGFRTARGVRPDGQTMRNMMGQVDGTVNPTPGPDLDGLVWDQGRDQPWFAGGTTMVLRRIRIELDTWDELDPRGRELTIGRRQDTGAPLTGVHEHDEPDLDATRMGIPVIPANAHIARAHHQTPRERFLRRAFNYDDPPPRGLTSDVGLVFTAFQQDIDAQFLPVQRRLAEADALNEWTTPIGSAVFAILPGVKGGEYLGQSLLT